MLLMKIVQDATKVRSWMRRLVGQTHKVNCLHRSSSELTLYINPIIPASETCSPRSLPQELVLTHAKLAMDQKKAGALRVSVL